MVSEFYGMLNRTYQHFFFITMIILQKMFVGRTLLITSFLLCSFFKHPCFRSVIFFKPEC